MTCDFVKVMKWVKFAEGFPSDPKLALEEVSGFNEELGTKSVLLGSGLTVSEADVVVYAILHSYVVCDYFLLVSQTFQNMKF